MNANQIWKWSVQTYNPECFQEEVVAYIRELDGLVEEVSSSLGESHYRVKLPAQILQEQLNTLIDLDIHSTWILIRAGSVNKPYQV